jgi:hypothetical protein
MPGNQQSCPGVWNEVLGDPRDMAKAGLPESQSPEGAKPHPPERRLKPAPPLRPSEYFSAASSGSGAMSNEDIQGDEWDAYVTLDTYDRDERGIAYGARALRRHSARSSRRSHDLPGRTVTPSTGPRGTGDRTARPRGRRNAERRTVPNVHRARAVQVTGEPRASKGARGVRRGATRKRACTAGTSPRGLPSSATSADSYEQPCHSM